MVRAIVYTRDFRQKPGHNRLALVDSIVLNLSLKDVRSLKYVLIFYTLVAVQVFPDPRERRLMSWRLS